MAESTIGEPNSNDAETFTAIYPALRTSRSAIVTLRAPMDPRERATSIWYRVAGLLRRKDLAIEMIEAEIRAAQHEVLLDAAKLVLSDEPVEMARHLRKRAEETIRPKGRTT